ALTIESHEDRREGDGVKHKLLGLDRSKMSKEEIRAWIDTEGNIDAGVLGNKRGVQITVTQKHREPLDAFASGIAEMGVRCKIWQNNRGLYEALIVDTEGVAKVIKEVGPFRTPQKREQVRLFMEKLQAPRRVRRRVIERSKKLLGL
ncbi:MAG TPA: LAGLIDADG family homing endonuclease, partial [Nitrososphaerales archaeon]|nr:LAGLIDADG family homing endonuclease [Nitrososphaerales archaeon]